MPIVIRHGNESPPTPAAPSSTPPTSRSFLNRLSFLLPVPPVTLTDKMIFADNLSTVLDAGLPIYDALDILQDEARNSRLRSIFGNLKERVRAGQPLWAGLDEYSDVFPPLFVGLVRVGESSGRLVDVLAKLSDKLRKESELRGKVLSAAAYPVIVLATMLIIGVLMAIFVIPKLAIVYQESGLEMPPQTQAFIAASTYAAEHWSAGLLLLAALAVTLLAVRRIPRVRLALGGAVLHLPIAGAILRHGEIIWFASNLRILLGSGFPVVEAFDLLAQTSKNPAYQRGIVAAGDRVAGGMTLASALASDRNLFPPVFARMIRVGEATGRLGETLEKLVRHYDAKLDRSLTGIAVLLNPILTLLIGAFVAATAFVIIMPIYGLIGGIS